MGTEHVAQLTLMHTNRALVQHLERALLGTKRYDLFCQYLFFKSHISFSVFIALCLSILHVEKLPVSCGFISADCVSDGDSVEAASICKSVPWSHSPLLGAVFLH
jgi:hypothetical protein